MQGFDIVGGGQLAALPTFQKQFGVPISAGALDYIVPAHILSAFSAIAPACEIGTTVLFVPLLEKFGRKPGILAAALISTGGLLLQQLATTWQVHLAGRGINGVYSHCPLITSILIVYFTEMRKELPLA